MVKLRREERELLKGLWLESNSKGWAVWVPTGQLVELRQVHPPQDTRRWRSVAGTAWYLARTESDQWLNESTLPLHHTELYALVFSTKQLAIGRAFVDVAEGFGSVAMAYRPLYPEPRNHRFGVWIPEDVQSVWHRVVYEGIQGAALAKFMASWGWVDPLSGPQDQLDGKKQNLPMLHRQLNIVGRKDEISGWRDWVNPHGSR